MSLLRLLTAGSSLKGIRDRRSPYKMTQQHLLPKFGAGKEAEEKPAVPVPQSRSPASRVREQTVSTAELIQRKENTPVKIADAVSGSETQPAASAPSAGVAPSRWARLKNPFRPQPPVRRVTAPLQAELSLDSVRVVRNDLNETDLEIAPAAQPPRTPVPPSPRVAAPPGAKRAWGRIWARFLGGRRT